MILHQPPLLYHFVACLTDCRLPGGTQEAYPNERRVPCAQSESRFPSLGHDGTEWSYMRGQIRLWRLIYDHSVAAYGDTG